MYFSNSLNIVSTQIFLWTMLCGMLYSYSIGSSAHNIAETQSNIVNQQHEHTFCICLVLQGITANCKVIFYLQEYLNIFAHISKEQQTTILVTYLINKQKRTLPNFYSKVIICWIYSVFHHRPSNLKIMNVHLSQRLALYFMYTLTVISATNTCMPGSQPKIIRSFKLNFGNSS